MAAAACQLQAASGTAASPAAAAGLIPAAGVGTPPAGPDATATHGGAAAASQGPMGHPSSAAAAHTQQSGRFSSQASSMATIDLTKYPGFSGGPLHQQQLLGNSSLGNNSLGGGPSIGSLPGSATVPVSEPQGFGSTSSGTLALLSPRERFNLVSLLRSRVDIIRPLELSVVRFVGSGASGDVYQVRGRMQTDEIASLCQAGLVESG